MNLGVAEKLIRVWWMPRSCGPCQAAAPTQQRQHRHSRGGRGAVLCSLGSSDPQGEAAGLEDGDGGYWQVKHSCWKPRNQRAARSLFGETRLQS